MCFFIETGINDNVHLAHKYLCIYVGLSVFKDFYIFDFFFFFVCSYILLISMLCLLSGERSFKVWD